VLYIAGARLEDTRLRRTERVATPRQADEELEFAIRDISLSGASFVAAERPPVGEIVAIGRTAGRVTRHFPDGFAIEFLR
jgi:hypothetical protein